MMIKMDGPLGAESFIQSLINSSVYSLHLFDLFIFVAAESARINLELKLSPNSNADLKKLEHEVAMLKKKLTGMRIIRVAAVHHGYGPQSHLLSYCGFWISRANSLFPVHMRTFCDSQMFAYEVRTMGLHS